MKNFSVNIKNYEEGKEFNRVCQDNEIRTNNWGWGDGEYWFGIGSDNTLRWHPSEGWGKEFHSLQEFKDHLEGKKSMETDRDFEKGDVIVITINQSGSPVGSVTEITKLISGGVDYKKMSGRGTYAGDFSHIRHATKEEADHYHAHGTYNINNVTTISVWTPVVGEYAMMLKAGGWGFSPDNDGCIAKITGVDGTDISGDIINPRNTPHSFSGVPIKDGDEIVCRKATQQEIDKEVPQTPSLTRPEPKFNVGDKVVGLRGSIIYTKEGINGRIKSEYTITSVNDEIGIITERKYAPKNKTWWYQIGDYTNMFVEEGVVLQKAEPTPLPFSDLDKPRPQVGDWVVCVREYGGNLFKKGMIGKLVEIEPNTYKGDIPYKVNSFISSDIFKDAWCCEVRSATPSEIRSYERGLKPMGKELPQKEPENWYDETNPIGESLSSTLPHQTPLKMKSKGKKRKLITVKQ